MRQKNEEGTDTILFLKTDKEFEEGHNQMKSNSIEKTLPRLLRWMIIFFLLLILPVNIYFQLYMHHQSQRENSKEVFGQLEQTIYTNAEDIKSAKEDFSRQCIQTAEMAGYFIEHYPETISSIEHTKELAQKLGVDEIHYFTPEGEIYAGTHPEYYGFTFYSGEQMEFFAPMLEDRSLKLCQDITPNTAEGKEMQYAAVWLEDGSGIIQIGMEPRRLLEKLEEKSLPNIISMMPLEANGHLHVVDKNTRKIIASTEENLIGTEVSNDFYKNCEDASINQIHCKFRGERYCVYTKDSGDYMLIRSYFSLYPLKEMFKYTALILLYIMIVSVGIIGIIKWYVNQKLTKNLTRVIHELKKIEDGNIANITLKTGITEFDELLFYINQMLDNIRSNWDKISYIMDKGKIPVGILERNTFYKKTFVNERMLDILGIENYKDTPLQKVASFVQEELKRAETHEIDPVEHIYEYDKNGETRYLRIEKEVEKQSITYYVTDISLWWEEIYQLREKSEIDLLTNLYNRRGFNEKMNTLFANPEKLGCAMMIMADADNLKKFNDIYGHHVGDEYLKGIAGLFKSAAGENAVCGRLGGDEFIIFLYGFSSIQELQEKAYSIRSKCGEPFISQQIDIEKTFQFSIGTAFYPMDGMDFHLLMRIADENMYQEKKKRKFSGGGYNHK